MNWNGEGKPFVPVNEQGVVVKFAQECSKVGLEIAYIGSAFPDAIVSKNGVQYRAELEYKLSNFLTHGHDVRDCDLVICWHNDLDDFPLPVIELSQPGWETTELFEANEKDLEIYYWRTKSERLERQRQK